MIPPRTFGRRLRVARMSAGLEQIELGELIGKDGPWISRRERGFTTSVEVAVLKKLCHVLHVSADWLLAMDVEEDEEPLPDDAELMTPHA